MSVTPPSTPPVIRSFGGGRCAVCNQKTRTGNLMCARHWDAVPFDTKQLVYDCLRRWKWNACSLEELRFAQGQAIEAVTGTSRAPTLEGSEDGPVTD